MQVALDTCDPTTAYADLREQESLTDALRARAIERARQLGAEHVEFWHPPYGRGADRMEGFIELARVSRAPELECDADELMSASAETIRERRTLLAPAEQREGDRDHV